MKPKQWDNLAESFNHLLTHDYNAKQIKNEWANLVRQYKAYHLVDQCSGIGAAGELAVKAWDELIAAHPETALYRDGTKFSLYDEMVIAVGNAYTTYENVESIDDLLARLTTKTDNNGVNDCENKALDAAQAAVAAIERQRVASRDKRALAKGAAAPLARTPSPSSKSTTAAALIAAAQQLCAREATPVDTRAKARVSMKSLRLPLATQVAAMQLFSNLTAAETFLAMAEDTELALGWLKAELPHGTFPNFNHWPPPPQQHFG
jgi:hypothetical protein